MKYLITLLQKRYHLLLGITIISFSLAALEVRTSDFGLQCQKAFNMYDYYQMGSNESPAPVLRVASEPEPVTAFTSMCTCVTLLTIQIPTLLRPPGITSKLFLYTLSMRI